MKTANQQSIIAIVTAAMLFAFIPVSHASDVATLVSKHGAACGTPGYTQMQDLKLAAKAQEGVEAFVSHYHQSKLIQQWTIEEALARARTAAVTSCAVAIGLKPIDPTQFATALAANSR